MFKFAILCATGGGATGCGVALDAATRGLRVGLVERDDYSAGTSSRSTKLVHGGMIPRLAFSFFLLFPYILKASDHSFMKVSSAKNQLENQLCLLRVGIVNVEIAQLCNWESGIVKFCLLLIEIFVYERERNRCKVLGESILAV